jgi:hypothetical protein
MYRTLALFAAILTIAFTAQAQVAAPDFLPSAPRYFLSYAPLINGTTLTPDNPAAQQWGGPSRIALGTMRLSENTSTDYSGYYLGGRVVRPGWSGGLEYSDAKGKAVGSAHEKILGLSLSALLGSALSVGYGYESYKELIAGDDFKDNTVGASLRVGKSFYLGAGYGSAKFANGPTSADRSTTMYGVALRTEGDTRWYLAYDVVDRDDFSNSVNLGVKESTGSLQAAFGGMVIGASQVKIAVKALPQSETIRQISVGWVPPKGGLSIVLHSTNGDDGAGTTDKGTNLTLAFMY